MYDVREISAADPEKRKGGGGGGGGGGILKYHVW